MSSFSMNDDDGGPLQDIVAFVDVRTDGQDSSAGVAERLSLLGATISKTFSKLVTHVIFKEGSNNTLRKLIELKKLGKRNVQTVSVLWVESCYTRGGLSDEAPYIITPEVTTPGKKAKKSMKPESVEAAAKRVRNAKRKSSGATAYNKEVCVDDDVWSDSAIEVSTTPKGKRRRSGTTSNSDISAESSPVLQSMRTAVVDEPHEEHQQQPRIEESEGVLNAASILVDTRKKSRSKRIIEDESDSDEDDFELLDTKARPTVTYSKSKKQNSLSKAGSPSKKSKEATPKKKRVSPMKNIDKNKNKSLRSPGSSSKDVPKVTKKQASPTKQADKPPSKNTKKTTSSEKVRKASTIEPLKDSSNSKRSKPSVKSLKSQPVKQKAKRSKGFRFVLSGFNDKSLRDCVVSSLKSLKGTIDERVSDNTTHIIAAGGRTLKVMEGIARGCWICDPSFALASLEAGNWLPEMPYERNDDFPGGCKTDPDSSKDINTLFATDSVGHVWFADKKLEQEISELAKLTGLTIITSRPNAKTIIGSDVLSKKNDQQSITAKWMFDSITNGSLQPLAPYVC